MSDNTHYREPASEKAEEKHKDHLQQAAVIKGVHAKLRQAYRQTGDASGTWTAHCDNRKLLCTYAAAMHQLAVHHWVVRPGTRIDWCRKTCRQYFLQGGREKVLAKDKRAEAHKKHTEPESSQSKCPLLEQSTTGQSVPGQSTTEESVPGQSTTEQCRESLSHSALRSEGRIRLLDVGSCFNPFVEFEEFIAIGIDISPAVESVFRCDLLTLEVSEPFNQVEPATVDSFLSTLKGPSINKLPGRMFHVIVFSLLLEYLPCTSQRWLCCQKAHTLLATNGLLLVITPDSGHQNRNAVQMKSWKRGLEGLGFRRWRYEKQEHLHCMAFRKMQAATPDQRPLPVATETVGKSSRDFNRNSAMCSSNESEGEPSGDLMIDSVNDSLRDFRRNSFKDSTRDAARDPMNDAVRNSSGDFTMDATDDFLRDSISVVSEMDFSSDCTIDSKKGETRDPPSDPMGNVRNKSGCIRDSTRNAARDSSRDSKKVFTRDTNKESTSDCVGAHMLYIPQDFSDCTSADETGVFGEMMPHTDEEVELIQAFFRELPDLS